MPKTRKVKKNMHKKKGQKGGAYGNTMNSMANNAKSNMGFGYSGPVKYNHCGGSKTSPEPTVIFNNRVGYGYNQSGASIASDVQGSYAPVSRYVASQCGAGKKAKKAKKSHKNKSKKNKTRKSVKKSKKQKKINKKIKKKKTSNENIRVKNIIKREAVDILNIRAIHLLEVHLNHQMLMVHH